MERRREAIGDNYPFQIGPDHIKIRSDAYKTPYISMLLETPSSIAVQLLGMHAGSDLQKASDMFEELTCLAVKGYLGEGSEAVIFGPNNLSRPVNFKDAIKWLAEKLRVTEGRERKPSTRKDGGVDVVGWKPHTDKRTGMTVLLIQSTIGKDIFKKTADIDLDLWKGWLKFRPDPTIAIATPCQIPFDDEWDEIAKKAMLFDRTRIANLVNVDGDSGLQGLQERNSEIIERLRARLEDFD